MDAVNSARDDDSWPQGFRQRYEPSKLHRQGWERQMADIPILQAIEGPMKGKRIVVPEEGGLNLGRADDNDIVLTGEGISRFHAVLLYDMGSLWLQDAGSRNGIFVNNERLTQHRALKAGDVLSIGEHRFRVRWDDEEEPNTSKTDSESGEKKSTWFWPFK